MTAKASVGRYTYDADSKVVLRALGSSAITASAASLEVPLDKLTAYWHGSDTDLAMQTFAVVIFVESSDGANGDEDYTFAVETDSATGFSSAVSVASVAFTNSAAPLGEIVIPLDVAMIQKLDPTAALLRLNVTLAGTTPSLGYGAWIAPITK